MPRKRTSPPPSPPAEPPLKVNKRKVPRQATSAVAFEYPYLTLPDNDPLLDFLPYCHKQPRRNSITPDVQRAFILELAATGIVTQAACKVGKSIEALYKLREKPGAGDFARAWDEALEWGRLRLEDCAMERAMAQGVHNPKANGMLCWVIQHRSHHMIDSREVKRGHWLWDSIHHDILGRWPDEDEDEETENLP